MDYDDDHIRRIVMDMLRQADSSMRTMQEPHYVDHMEQAQQQAHSGEVTMHRFNAQSMGLGTGTSSSSSQARTYSASKAIHPQAIELVARWKRLVRQLLRLRFHQRLWGNLGQFLQLYPQHIRRAVQQRFPKLK
jgi:hypothetical protein